MRETDAQVLWGPDNEEGDLWFPVLACQMLETDAEVLWGPDNGEGGMWFRVLECYLHGELVGAEDLLERWEESRMDRMLLLFEFRGNKSRER